MLLRESGAVEAEKGPSAIAVDAKCRAVPYRTSRCLVFTSSLSDLPVETGS